MATFLIKSRLHIPLQAHDWWSFARGDNGPNYLINRYDVRLASEFQKYPAGAVPEVSVRAAHLYLTHLGLHPGPIDGVAGVGNPGGLFAVRDATCLPRQRDSRREFLDQTERRRSELLGLACKHAFPQAALWRAIDRSGAVRKKLNPMARAPKRLLFRSKMQIKGPCKFMRRVTSGSGSGARPSCGRTCAHPGKNLGKIEEHRHRTWLVRNCAASYPRIPAPRR
jgi:hypothetical protein